MTLETIERYDRNRVGPIGQRAVVVGASMAGLSAARVLADAFDEVVVFDRDPLPDEPVTRDGAPQTHHPHVMLEAGRATLEDFFPGFGEDLIEAGGLMVDASTEMEMHDRGGFLADGPKRLTMYCASRPLFEAVVRRRVRALDGVRLAGERQCLGYQLDDAGERVTGVTVRPGERATETGERSVEADLVVDATGRTSRTPAWLADNGFVAPAVDEVTVDLTYSTVRVERPPDDRSVLAVAPVPPRTRGGAVIPIEGDAWQVILQGVHGDDSPKEATDLLAFARELPVSTVADVLESGELLSDGVDWYPFPASRRHRYEDLEQFPGGLVVTGDAIASFNPIYGQGMSVATLDALALHHALADGRLGALGPRFFVAAAPAIDAVWRMAVGGDFRFGETAGPKPRGTDLFNWYVGKLVRRAQSDGDLADAYLRVFRLERSATSLLRPGIVRRVLFGR